MSYAESLMAKDEQILFRGRQHWLAPVSDSLKPFVLVLVGLLLFFGELNFKPDSPISTAWLVVAAVILVIGLVWIGIVDLTWRAQEYVITNRRVLKVEGLIDKKSGDSSLDKINDAVLSQGVLARILHYGSLEILTSNEQAIDRYTMLANAVAFKKAMLDAKNNLEDGYRGNASTPRAAAPAVGHSGSDDVTATLAKLADLRDKGAITPAEYEAKKAELLGRL